jgi:hypothetical protein
LLRLRNNSGNSFIHDINNLDRVCDEFNVLGVVSNYSLIRQLDYGPSAPNREPYDVSPALSVKAHSA